MISCDGADFQFSCISYFENVKFMSEFNSKAQFNISEFIVAFFKSHIQITSLLDTAQAVVLLWRNRLARRTYKQYLPKRCGGCEFEPHLEHAFSSYYLFNRPPFHIFQLQNTPYLVSLKLPTLAYFNPALMPLKYHAPGEDRTHDLQISLWSFWIMRLTRCLLRYQGRYLKPVLILVIFSSYLIN